MPTLKQYAAASSLAFSLVAGGGALGGTPEGADAPESAARLHPLETACLQSDLASCITYLSDEVDAAFYAAQETDFAATAAMDEDTGSSLEEAFEDMYYSTSCVLYDDTRKKFGHAYNDAVQNDAMDDAKPYLNILMGEILVTTGECYGSILDMVKDFRNEAGAPPNGYFAHTIAFLEEMTDPLLRTGKQMQIFPALHP